MATFDYIYDLIEKFKKDKFCYVLTFLQKGKKTDQVHVFYEYETAEQGMELIHALKIAISDIEDEIGPDIEGLEGFDGLDEGGGDDENPF